MDSYVCAVLLTCLFAWLSFDIHTNLIEYRSLLNMILLSAFFLSFMLPALVRFHFVNDGYGFLRCGWKKRLIVPYYASLEHGGAEISKWPRAALENNLRETDQSG